jgi:large subunit ribosomal protein L4
MQVAVYKINGQTTGRSVELPEAVFGIEPNQHVVWLAVKAFLANQRQGTHKSKQRNEIAGSTRKLHKQKGTGGSRKGAITNPLYHGGGRVFGPQPRDYTQKLNKKVRNLARKSVLSAKAKEGSVLVVEDFTFAAPKTKEFISLMANLKVSDKKALFLVDEYNETVYRSSRNIPNADVTRATDLNVYNTMNANVLVFTESAVANIEASFAK